MRSQIHQSDKVDMNKMDSDQHQIYRLEPDGSYFPDSRLDFDGQEPIDEGNNDEKSTPEMKVDEFPLDPQAKFQERLRLRANVILELINTERDYVKHLKNVVEGYLHRARKHVEIFTSQRINTIFANIEQIYEFQRKFLKDLEDCIFWDDLAQSEVAACFLNHEKGFSVYHYYCNNHFNATSELQELYTKPICRAFFEECRLKQNMIDISLDGFLLTPIQRICKYPLQLNELLKNTDESHPDYLNVLTALEKMRNCANLANERKRRIEALADLILFQEKFDNWFGPKLCDTSSILIHSGEVSKMTSHGWSQGVQLHLLDHLLLYSKRDLLKRNSLILKGRICMDSVTEISDASEYKSRKSFKLYCSEQQKWFVFTTKSEKEKDEWIHAFERERNLVDLDETEGFHITDRELGIARRTLLHRKRSRSARFRPKRPDTAIVDQLDLDDPNMMINRTLSLPSCIHPSHVMNFVEDPRASTTNTTARKKDSSPISNSRSPVASTMQLIEQLDPAGPSNWLRKMGSKKLSRSQVYNINGQTGQQPQNQPMLKCKSQFNFLPDSEGDTSASASTTSPAASSNSPNPNNSAVLTNTDVAALKYEELERRYRDHMVSEEQARLYRLNNDLPLNIDPPAPTARHKHHPPRVTALNVADTNDADVHRNHLDKFRALSIASEHSSRSRAKAEQANSATFEAELVLSSGRVVRVREDAV